MRIFCPAIASLRPSLSSFGALLRPPRSGVSCAWNTRDPPLRRPGFGDRGPVSDRNLGMVSGPAHQPDVSLGRAPAASPEQPEYCARDQRRNANRGLAIPHRVSQSRGPRGLRFQALADLVGSLDDLGDPAGADGAATFTDRELQTVLHR